MASTTVQGKTGIPAASLYLGAAAADPTAQTDGSALVAGNYYFKTGDALTYTYNGATWVASDINTANLAASGGAALVGVIQSGSGAVARTLEAKSREWTTLADFTLTADYNTAAAALARTGKASFGGAIYANEIGIHADHADSTFIGRDTGLNNNTPVATNGIYNTFVGSQSGKANTSGYAQAFFGYNSGVNNTTGGRNTFLGYQSGLGNISGNDNVFVGVDAGYGNTVAHGSVVIGFHAGRLLDPAAGNAQNVIIGSDAVSAAASTSTLCSIVGWRSGYSLTTGFANTFMGSLAGFAATAATYTTCVGESTGKALTDGAGNSLFGSRAGYGTTSGAANTFIGQAAGFTNILGGSSVFLGYQAGYYETADNKLFIDNTKRASEADGRIKAMIYGVFASTPASQILRLNANVGINTQSFGTSADSVLSIGTGVAPTTGPADTVQFYSSDNSAGNTIPSFYCEGAEVLATGQADSASSVRVKMRINGTVVTLLAV